MPPSTTRLAAVTNEASSLARNATAPATSAGSANRPAGTWTSRRADRRRPPRTGPASSAWRPHRGDRVDADAVTRELDAELAAEREHAALARGVGDLGRRRPHQRRGRGHVDDRPRALPSMIRQHGLAPEVDAGQVDLLHAPPRAGARPRGSSRRRAGRRPPRGRRRRRARTAARRPRRAARSPRDPRRRSARRRRRSRRPAPRRRRRPRPRLARPRRRAGGRRPPDAAAAPPVTTATRPSRRVTAG